MSFGSYDLSTVSANLSGLLHHYDEVDSVLRIVQKEDYNGLKNVALVSAVPPLEDDERSLVMDRLEENGFEYTQQNGRLVVTGVSDSEKFTDFMQG